MYVYVPDSRNICAALTYRYLHNQPPNALINILCQDTCRDNSNKTSISKRNSFHFYSFTGRAGCGRTGEIFTHLLCRMLSNSFVLPARREQRENFLTNPI